ncbi:COR domain-containing protein [Labilibaculum euxinus]
MKESIKCNLYILGYNATGKTILVNKIIGGENSYKTRPIGFENTDWQIKYENRIIDVEIKERASFDQRVSKESEIDYLDNSLVILMVRSIYNDGENNYERLWNDYLNKIPSNCLVLLFFNKTKDDEINKIDFKSLKEKYPFIREVLSYDLQNDKLDEFNYLLENIIINRYTDRLNYARNIIKENLLSKNPELDLGNCSLTSLYEVEELFDNTHIEKLILSNEWAAFRNVKWHKIPSKNELGKNSLGDLHPNMSKLKNLKHLIAGGDWNDGKSWWNRWRIHDLSPILNLPELEYLNISNNKISLVPSISKLKKLRILHLNNNEITNVKIRRNCISLEEIYLSNNHLTSISFVKFLLVAKTIDLHGNKIKSLAPILSQFERMNVTNSKWEQNTINIAKNPLEQPPMEIVNISKEAVISYFNDLSRGGSFVNKDIKLILVGNSEVGKTTLAKYLNNEIDLDKEHPATHWLDEKQLKSKYKIEKIKERCNINLFDFGGHDYFHDTHHLFFSKNTVYLLLWDKDTNNLNYRIVSQKNSKNEIVEVKTQDYPIKYWLDSIKYFTKEKETQNFDFEIEKEDKFNSLTLLIQNKANNTDEIVHLNNSAIIKQYPFVFEFVNISLRPNKRNHHYLDSLITELLNKTEIIGSKLPDYYRIVKDNIKIYKGKPILSVKEFNNYCNKLIQENINLEQTTYLAEYLKQIGIILFYPISKSGDKIYIKKKWVIDQIYNILEGLTKKNGEFDRSHIKSTLNRNCSEDEIDSIIQLMIEFKIIFEHPDSKSFIAPLYLPAHPIKAVELFIDSKKIPCRRFLYNGFIHKNVILAFFQEYGKLVVKENSSLDNGLYYYWKDGLVIKDSASNEIVMVQFNIGDTDGNAFIDVVQINNDFETKFVQEVIDFLKMINKDYEIEEMVTLDGIDYVSLEVLNRNAKDGRLVFSENRISTDIDLIVPVKKEFKLKDYKMFLKSGIKKKKVAISYSKKDLVRVHTLIRYLKPLVDLELIEQPWYCTLANPADEWDSKIQSKFKEADIVFFMVSEYFYSTEYIVEKEIKVTIDRYEKDKSLKIIPIILEHYEWGRKEPYNLKRFSALPFQAKPISDFNNEKLAWNTITVCVRAMIEKDLDPGKIDLISRELQEIYERQVEGKLDFNSN